MSVVTPALRMHLVLDMFSGFDNQGHYCSRFSNDTLDPNSCPNENYAITYVKNNIA